MLQSDWTAKFLQVYKSGSTICWNLFLDSGFWILDSGFWNLESGFWNLESGTFSTAHAQYRQQHALRCSTKPLAEMEELEEVGFFMLGVRRLTLKGCIFPIFSTKSLWLRFALLARRVRMLLLVLKHCEKLGACTCDSRPLGYIIFLLQCNWDFISIWLWWETQQKTASCPPSEVRSSPTSSSASYGILCNVAICPILFHLTVNLDHLWRGSAVKGNLLPIVGGKKKIIGVAIIMWWFVSCSADLLQAQCYFVRQRSWIPCEEA